METDIVADFSAFLSIVVDDKPVLETREGRVIMTREELRIAGDDEEHRLPLESLQDFDFRTVPAEWEQFFDDLVGVRFSNGDTETIVTIGTDTQIADQFVTVLLKLRLAETTTKLHQQVQPVADSAADSTVTTETAFTLLPQSERIEFAAPDTHPIDISLVTGVATSSESRAVIVRQLREDGSLRTELLPRDARGATFLETYLKFRTEVSPTAGPLQFVFAGDNRDTLVLLAKLLKHRQLEFNAGHVETPTALQSALEEPDVQVECVVLEHEFGEESSTDIIAGLREAGHELPIIVVTRERTEPVTIDDPAVQVVTIGSRTDHYEDVVAAIQQAVYDWRTRAGPTGPE